ncbi:TetR/AcrR family transcriptional regulator [Streptomyces sp. SID10853]|uniref:TetR/AcrR family transcriptional regulator n=1 Tax=Streptomyces sp. SID10853 TaxID=2706028 RepID=UPI0013C0EE0D|nr:TetR/AcrR family transcriptional regulator [Streptomyces sp. SID10853]NDZ81546.1 TetR/AcrR family transcriptional regulator [Streptomyces sp. SID10853]
MHRHPEPRPAAVPPSSGQPSCGPRPRTGRGEGERLRNARGEGERLRTEIIEAVLRLIADQQRMRPVPLSLREVAREAGITAPAIYRHFSGKDELTRAALGHLFGELLADLDSADRAAAGQSPAARLAALAHAYARFAEENPTSFRVMFNGVGPHDEGPAEVAARWRTAVGRLTEPGARHTRSPEAAAVSVWSSVHGRLLLDRPAGGVWQLGDVHAFIDDLTRSLQAPALPDR